MNNSKALSGQDDESVIQYKLFDQICQQLSPSEQRKLIPQLIQEVVLDPQQSTNSFTFNPETVNELAHFIQTTEASF